jgi:signal transduction histidine kinase
MLRFSFASIRVRLILLILFATLPAFGLVLYTAIEEQRLAATAAQKEALRLARLVAEDHRELIEETRGLLIAMAQYSAVRNHDSAQCNEFFTALLQHYRGDYTNLAAIGRDGNMICSAIPVTQPFSAAHELWFRQAMQSRDFSLSDYRIGRVSGKAQVSLTYSVLGPDDQVHTIVLAGLSLDRVKPLIAKVQLPMGSVAALIDHNGIVLARYPESGESVGHAFSNAPIFGTNLINQSDGQAQSAAVDGVSRFYAFTHLGVAPRNKDVSVIVGIPEEIVLAQANRTLKRNLILLGLVGILAMMVAWLVGNLFIIHPVSSLVAATEHLAAGNLSVRTGPPYQDGELGELKQAFDKMAETLQTRQADAKRAEEELRGSREQLRQLAAHLQSVREEERTRISREIHDGLGQALTGLKMDLSWLIRKRDENHNSLSQDSLREKTKSLLDVVDSIIQTVRTISTELRPGVLDYLGLAAAIEWQVHEFQKRTATECELSLPTEEIPIDATCSTAMFRIFQETLTNIARHAQATKVKINLEEKDNSAILEVADNGRGIRQSNLSDPKSLGLLGIRERALLLGGEVSIRRNDGEGTTVSVRIPLRGSESTMPSQYD